MDRYVNDGALKAILTPTFAGPRPEAKANQVPVERPSFAYIGQSACQARYGGRNGIFA
jgi:hypothetical protein